MGRLNHKDSGGESRPALPPLAPSPSSSLPPAAGSFPPPAAASPPPATRAPPPHIPPTPVSNGVCLAANGCAAVVDAAHVSRVKTAGGGPHHAGLRGAPRAAAAPGARARGTESANGWADAVGPPPRTAPSGGPAPAGVPAGGREPPRGGGAGREPPLLPPPPGARAEVAAAAETTVAGPDRGSGSRIASVPGSGSGIPAAAGAVVVVAGSGFGGNRGSGSATGSGASLPPPLPPAGAGPADRGSGSAPGSESESGPGLPGVSGADWSSAAAPPPRGVGGCGVGVEEVWVLFKPPPAFPVGSSSARTVPRISYASKVKENLLHQALHHQRLAANPASIPPPPTPPTPPPSSPSSPSPRSLNGHAGGPLAAGWGAPPPRLQRGPPPPPRAAPSSAIRSPGGAGLPAGMSNGADRRHAPAVAAAATRPAVAAAAATVAGEEVAPARSIADIFTNEWGLSFFDSAEGGGAARTSDGRAPGAHGGGPHGGGPHGGGPHGGGPHGGGPHGGGPHGGGPHGGAAGLVSAPAEEEVERPLVEWEEEEVEEEEEALGGFDLRAAVVYHTREWSIIANHLKQAMPGVRLYVGDC